MSAAYSQQIGRTLPEPPSIFDGVISVSIAAETKSILAGSDALRDQLAMTLSPSTATFASLVRPLADDANRAACRLSILGNLLASVSPDLALRDASREAAKQIAAAELVGVPDDALATMKGANGQGSNHPRDKLWVTFRNDHFRDVMRYASNGETRQRLYVAQQHRFPENVTRLAKILVLRDEIAHLLGFENHAALKMEEKMAQSVSEVESRLYEYVASCAFHFLSRHLTSFDIFKCSRWVSRPR